MQSIYPLNPRNPPRFEILVTQDGTETFTKIQNRTQGTGPYGVLSQLCHYFISQKETLTSTELIYTPIISRRPGILLNSLTTISRYKITLLHTRSDAASLFTRITKLLPLIPDIPATSFGLETPPHEGLTPGCYASRFVRWDRTNSAIDSVVGTPATCCGGVPCRPSLRPVLCMIMPDMRGQRRELGGSRCPLTYSFMFNFSSYQQILAGFGRQNCEKPTGITVVGYQATCHKCWELNYRTALYPLSPSIYLLDRRCPKILALIHLRRRH